MKDVDAVIIAKPISSMLARRGSRACGSRRLCRKADGEQDEDARAI